MLHLEATYVSVRAVDVNVVSAALVDYRAEVSSQDIRAVDVNVLSDSLTYRATITHVDPDTEVYYRKLFVEFYADYDSKHRFISDGADALDQIAKAFTKHIQDSVGISDSVYFSLSKFPADDVTSSDTVTFTISWLRTYADSVTESDQITVAFTKVLADTQTVSDAISNMVKFQSGAINTNAVNVVSVDDRIFEVII